MPILLGNNILGQVLHSSGVSNYRLRKKLREPLASSTEEDSAIVRRSGSPSGPGFTVPGVLLACVSVIFIIIGIAFVYSRFRRSKPTPEQDQPDIEMRSKKEENDPYMEWLNMPEEPLPPPALGKQVKTAVRTVSRKMSLTPKPTTDDFKPGVPPHLRYQLKEIYVY
ncbi:hypothetical protein FHG87_004470 [Trinorchestia longiramus]|nr:hypothetical protein FHG87_004470 [Trinorchestia longiramus]